MVINDCCCSLFFCPHILHSMLQWSPSRLDDLATVCQGMVMMVLVMMMVIIDGYDGDDD